MNKTPVNVLSALVIALPLCTSAIAEIVPDTHLDLKLEAAQIIGSGRALNIYKVPVSDTNTGDVIYYDVSLALTVQDDGSLTFENFRHVELSGYPATVSSTIVDGTYEDLAGARLVVETLGTSEGGVLRRIYEPSDDKPFEGSWLDGTGNLDPLDLFASEYESNLSSEWSYGEETGSSSSYHGRFYDLGGYSSDNRFGIQQSGDDLTIIGLDHQGNEVDRFHLKKVN